MSPSNDTRKRWLLVVGAYALIVLASASGLWALQKAGEHACHERASDREVLREVVDIATGNASGPVDLTKIGGFNQLSPSTQEYLRNLSRSLSAGADAETDVPLHDRLVALLPPIQC